MEPALCIVVDKFNRSTQENQLFSEILSVERKMIRTSAQFYLSISDIEQQAKQFLNISSAIQTCIAVPIPTF